MKNPGSTAAAIVVVTILSANLQAQGGPQGPQMRGDGPPPQARPFSITREDPALDQIIAPGREAGRARARLRPDGRRAVDAGGQRRLVDLRGAARQRPVQGHAQKEVSVFMEKAGYTGNDPEHVGTQTRSGREPCAPDRAVLHGNGPFGPRDLVRRQRPSADASREGRHPHGAVGRHERSEIQRPERHRHRRRRRGLSG